MGYSLKFCFICSSCFFKPTVCFVHWNFVLYVPHVSLNQLYELFTVILFYMFLMFIWTYCMFYSLKFCFSWSSCFFEPTLCLIHWNFVLYFPHVSLNLLYAVWFTIYSCGFFSKLCYFTLVVPQPPI